MNKIDGYQYFKTLNKILNDNESYSKNSKQSNIENEENSNNNNKHIEESDSSGFENMEKKICEIEKEKEFDEKNNEGKDIVYCYKSNEIIDKKNNSSTDFVPFNKIKDNSDILYNNLPNNEEFNDNFSYFQKYINEKGKFYINN